MFIMAELAMLITLATIAASADKVINGTASTSPLKIVKHPSTYFDRVKPVYNEFSHYGVHMRLPIGDVLNHAREVMYFITTAPMDRGNLSNFKGHSKMDGNNITSTLLPADQVWQAAMEKVLRVKSSSVANKINDLDKTLKVHAVPADNFLEALTMHHATTAKFEKRSIDFKFDITSAISTFFSGVNSIFHFKAISEVSQAVNNLQISQSHLEDFTEKFAKKVADLLILLKHKQAEDAQSIASALTIFMLLDEAESCLDTITAAVTPLLQGILPTCVVTPANLVEIYDTVKANAAKKGFRLAISNPNEILTLQPFTYQKDNSYELLLSIPIVDKDQQFPTYHLVNLPTLRNKVPTVWDIPNLLFGLRPSLYPQSSEYITLEISQVKKSCSEYFEMMLCTIPTITKPSCISDLFHNRSDHCTTKTLTYTPILQPESQKHLFFFEDLTQALIQCQKSFSKVMVQGLVQIEDKANCQIITSDFSFSFVGTEPLEIFEKFPPKIVSENLMPAKSETVEDNMEKDIKSLYKTIHKFNETKIKQTPIPSPPVISFINLGIAVFALMLIGVLIFLFISKARRLPRRQHVTEEVPETKSGAKPNDRDQV